MRLCTLEKYNKREKSVRRWRRRGREASEGEREREKQRDEDVGKYVSGTCEGFYCELFNGISGVHFEHFTILHRCDYIVYTNVCWISGNFLSLTHSRIPPPPLRVLMITKFLSLALALLSPHPTASIYNFSMVFCVFSTSFSPFALSIPSWYDTHIQKERWNFHILKNSIKNQSEKFMLLISLSLPLTHSTCNSTSKPESIELE